MAGGGWGRLGGLGGRRGQTASVRAGRPASRPVPPAVDHLCCLCVKGLAGLLRSQGAAAAAAAPSLQRGREQRCHPSGRAAARWRVYDQVEESGGARGRGGHSNGGGDGSAAAVTLAATAAAAAFTATAAATAVTDAAVRPHEPVSPLQGRWRALVPFPHPPLEQADLDGCPLLAPVPPRKGSRQGDVRVRARNVFVRRHVDCWHPNSRLKTRSRGVGRPKKWCRLAVTPSCACRPPPPTVCRGVAGPPRPQADGRLPRTARPLAPPLGRRGPRAVLSPSSSLGLGCSAPPHPCPSARPLRVASPPASAADAAAGNGTAVGGGGTRPPVRLAAARRQPPPPLACARCRCGTPAATGGRGGGCVGDGAWFWGCARGGAA